MGTLYFTRHGQTFWNVENKICGCTDIGLTELGHEQAEELGRQIAQQQLEIDAILYSPLQRAADTARHISEMTGIACYPEERLREQNFGKFEGTPRDGAAFLEAKKQFVNRFETGESMLQLCQRIYNLLDEVCAQEDQTYLLVAHNGIARAVCSYFVDMPNDAYSAYGIRNCELCRYDF